MEPKIFKFHGRDLYFTKGTYSSTNNLYLGLITTDGMPFANVTVNLSPLLNKSEAYLNHDLWSFDPEIINILILSGFAKHTNKTIRSGFVEFPLLEFNLTNLAPYIAKEITVLQ